MKARIERERIPAGEDPQFHLKLGRGSLSDVEWTVQLLQLHVGGAASRRRVARPRARWCSQGLLDAADAAVLAEAYRFCEATRNRLYLVRSRPSPRCPQDPNELTVAGPLARHHALGAARALPAGHPPGPDRHGAPLLRGAGRRAAAALRR